MGGRRRFPSHPGQVVGLGSAGRLCDQVVQAVAASYWADGRVTLAEVQALGPEGLPSTKGQAPLERGGQQPNYGHRRGRVTEPGEAWVSSSVGSTAG